MSRCLLIGLTRCSRSLSCIWWNWPISFWDTNYINIIQSHFQFSLKCTLFIIHSLTPVPTALLYDTFSGVHLIPWLWLMLLSTLSNVITFERDLPWESQATSIKEHPVNSSCGKSAVVIHCSLSTNAWTHATLFVKPPRVAKPFQEKMAQ